jgi:D-glycero-D-manno-heptose 1,7-bisphosphate phosphatase
MLLDAAAALGIDLTESFMVGDRRGDVDAGQRAGCRTVFLDRGYAEPQPDAPDLRTQDLTTAVEWILQQRANPGGPR